MFFSSLTDRGLGSKLITGPLGAATWLRSFTKSSPLNMWQESPHCRHGNIQKRSKKSFNRTLQIPKALLVWKVHIQWHWSFSLNKFLRFAKHHTHKMTRLICKARSPLCLIRSNSRSAPISSPPISLRFTNLLHPHSDISTNLSHRPPRSSRDLAFQRPGSARALGHRLLKSLLAFG